MSANANEVLGVKPIAIDMSSARSKSRMAFTIRYYAV